MKSVNSYARFAASGHLDLTLPSNNAYRMKVNARKIKVAGLKDFNGKTDDDKMDGTIGNDGLEIEVKTSQRANLSFK